VGPSSFKGRTAPKVRVRQDRENGVVWLELTTAVMAGLVPAIHAFALSKKQDVDARDKRGHDDGGIRPRRHK
jgi:hypothetical protein